jgi:hypothetical protein
MSKIIALSQVLLNPFEIFQSKVFALPKVQKQTSAKIWAYTLIGLNLALFFSYIVGVNVNTSQGYEIKKVQNQIAVSTEQNKKLNLKISEISSMVKIQNDLVGQSFVSAGTPKFLEVKQYSLK